MMKKNFWKNNFRKTRVENRTITLSNIYIHINEGIYNNYAQTRGWIKSRTFELHEYARLEFGYFREGNEDDAQECEREGSAEPEVVAEAANFFESKNSP